MKPVTRWRMDKAKLDWKKRSWKMSPYYTTGNSTTVTINGTPLPAQSVAISRGQPQTYVVPTGSSIQWQGITNASTTTPINYNQWTSSTTVDLQVDAQVFADAINRLGSSFRHSADAFRRAAPPRDFNRYLNASDLLEEFITWLGTEGVRGSEVMDLPVELFVKWLIVRACEADDEEPNVELVVPRRSQQPRCLGCQRFMARRVRVPLHGPRCADLHFKRASKMPA